jgi:hypothetical protein
MSKYKRKSEFIQAVQWDGTKDLKADEDKNKLLIEACESGNLIITMLGNALVTTPIHDSVMCPGDYLVKDEHGEYHVYKRSEFEKIYEPVETTQEGRMKFTLSVDMEERWVPYFMSMLKHMEYLGNIGSSRTVSIYSDGDGGFRPKFNTDVEWEKKKPATDNFGNVTYDAG